MSVIYYYIDKTTGCVTECRVIEYAGPLYPSSIVYKSTAGRYRPVSYTDGPITARCKFIKNAYWVAIRATRKIKAPIALVGRLSLSVGWENGPELVLKTVSF